MSRIRSVSPLSDVDDIERTPLDWKLAGIFAPFLEEMTGRDDLYIRVGRRTSAQSGRNPVTGEPKYVAGVWWETEKVIELDGSYVDDDADLTDVDLTNPGTLSDVAIVLGVAIHEGGHVLHTLWNWDALFAMDRRVQEVVKLLEESRMEAQRIHARPGCARWIRAALTRVLLDEISTVDKARIDAARVAALVLARVDTGVFDADSVSRTREVVVELIGEDVLAQLEDLWLEAQECEDGDLDGLADVARRWCDLIGMSDDDVPDDDSTIDPGELTGESGGFERIIWTISEDLGEIAEEVAGELEEEAADDTAAKERDRAERARSEAERRKADERATAIKASKEASDRLFPPSSGRSSGGKHSPGLKGWREPTDIERHAAMTLGARLQAELFTPPGQEKNVAETPPGRLNSRGLIERHTQRIRGVPVTAKMWEQTTLVHQAPLRLTTALLADRSGSMKAAMNDLVGAVWVIADASRHNGANFASALFGLQAEPLCAPGTIPALVPIIEPDAPEEAIGDALEGIRGALDLDDPSTVRLVIIASDCHWVNEDQDYKGREQIRQLQEAGCTVIVIHNDGNRVERDHGCPVFIIDPSNYADALADIIISNLNRDIAERAAR